MKVKLSKTVLSLVIIGQFVGLIYLYFTPPTYPLIPVNHGQLTIKSFDNINDVVTLNLNTTVPHCQTSQDSPTHSFHQDAETGNLYIQVDGFIYNKLRGKMSCPESLNFSNTPIQTTLKDDKIILVTVQMSKYTNYFTLHRSNSIITLEPIHLRNLNHNHASTSTFKYGTNLFLSAPDYSKQKHNAAY